MLKDECKATQRTTGVRRLQRSLLSLTGRARRSVEWSRIMKVNPNSRRSSLIIHRSSFRRRGVLLLVVIAFWPSSR